ncbi:MAG TPA: ribbon-helix-helix domain-containing protein [Phycisphaerae bacterium]|nr:ribbon-helix-helix domain-containing protein [Phycisphaerae bacterium]
MTSVQVEFPDDLAKRLDQLVAQGWMANRQQAIVEALRRFLDAHRPELMKSQMLADVEWGLHGKE